MAGGAGRMAAFMALVVMMSMAMADVVATSRSSEGRKAGRGRTEASDAPLELASPPWSEEREERKQERLEDVLKAIKQAEAADGKAAQQEKAFGGKELADANSATAQAARFMGKAEKLLQSEEALKQEEVGSVR